MKKVIHVRHILVKHAYEAEDLLKKIKKPEDFSVLAEKYSQCPSSVNGGDLGVIEVHRLDFDFVEAAENLKPGQISKPVRTRFGYHLIMKVS